MPPGSRGSVDCFFGVRAKGVSHKLVGNRQRIKHVFLADRFDSVKFAPGVHDVLDARQDCLEVFRRMEAGRDAMSERNEFASGLEALGDRCEREDGRRVDGVVFFRHAYSSSPSGVNVTRQRFPTLNFSPSSLL